MAEITPEDMTRHIAAEERRKAVYTARETRSAKMPQVMSWVFALRGAGYWGSGFHYALEARAGRAMAGCNPEAEVHATSAMMEEMGWDMLLADIDSAEETASYPDRDSHRQDMSTPVAIYARVRRRLVNGFDAQALAEPAARLFAKHGSQVQPSRDSEPMFIAVLRDSGAIAAAVGRGLLTVETRVERDKDVHTYTLTAAGKALTADEKAR